MACCTLLSHAYRKCKIIIRETRKVFCCRSSWLFNVCFFIFFLYSDVYSIFSTFCNHRFFHWNFLRRETENNNHTLRLTQSLYVFTLPLTATLLPLSIHFTFVFSFRFCVLLFDTVFVGIGHAMYIGYTSVHYRSSGHMFYLHIYLFFFSIWFL